MGRAKGNTLPTPPMKKRARRASSKSKSKSKQKHDDRLSKLPDEILVSILSLLTISEAARTSVLSPRWERLWIPYTGTLDFDFTKRLSNVKQELWDEEKSQYISWINQVLPILLGSSSSSPSPSPTTLDAFTVRLEIYTKETKSHIDSWIEFAMTKRIQRLELDVDPIEFPNLFIAPYNFTDKFYSWIKQPCGLHWISSLTSLSLKYVNVSGEIVEYFLSNCPLLERLRVVDSKHLLSLNVVTTSSSSSTSVAAPPLKLKYLEISRCSNLKSVEISNAPNLRSLNYIGDITKLHVENVPNLVEVSTGGRDDVITYMSSSISSYLPQLQTLRLEFNIKVNKEFTTQSLLVLNKLKHLTLSVDIEENEEIISLLGWTSLIEASPFLQKFTLEACTPKPRYRRKAQEATTSTSTSTRHPHQCLKVVELVGFTGCATEVELVMYFLASAIKLEQILIDCCHWYLRGTPYQYYEINKAARKKRALQLKRYLPPGVDLVFV